jgi:hypothetical protein
MRRSVQRSAVAAWLGLVALAIQAGLPLLVAVESTLAARAGADSVFEMCEYGHVHLAEETPGSSHHHHHHDGDGDGLCPICIALHAGSVFTAPAPLALPLPVAAPIAAALPELRSAPRFASLAAYRSRAPPPG